MAAPARRASTAVRGQRDHGAAAGDRRRWASTARSSPPPSLRGDDQRAGLGGVHAGVRRHRADHVHHRSRGGGGGRSRRARRRSSPRTCSARRATSTRSAPSPAATGWPWSVRRGAQLRHDVPRSLRVLVRRRDRVQLPRDEGLPHRRGRRLLHGRRRAAGHAAERMRNFGHVDYTTFDGVGINAKGSELHAAMGLCNLAPPRRGARPPPGDPRPLPRRARPTWSSDGRVVLQARASRAPSAQPRLRAGAVRGRGTAGARARRARGPRHPPRRYFSPGLQRARTTSSRRGAAGGRRRGGQGPLPADVPRDDRRRDRRRRRGRSSRTRSDR